MSRVRAWLDDGLPGAHTSACVLSHASSDGVMRQKHCAACPGWCKACLSDLVAHVCAHRCSWAFLKRVWQRSRSLLVQEIARTVFNAVKETGVRAVIGAGELIFLGIIAALILLLNCTISFTVAYASQAW